MTETQQRQRGLDLASQVQDFLRRRLEAVTERAHEGRASESQLHEARRALASSTRAMRNLKRRTWGARRSA